MKRIIAIMLGMTLVVSATGLYGQKKKERDVLFGSSYNYEITTVKVGQDGTKYVKVWAFGKKVDQAVVQAKKSAVAAAIFRGIPGCSTAMPTPAICSDPNAEENHQAYFENFFATGGPYLKFVNMTTDGVPSGTDCLQVKGGYKVAIYAQIMYDNLRKQLEADGIVKKLNSGF